MNIREDFSEEQLNAFVDGELDSEEQAQLLSESEQNAEMEKLLCQQRKMKELVNFAYKDVPNPSRLFRSGTSGTSMMPQTLVASVLLLVGIVVGFTANQQMNPSSNIAQTPLPTAIHSDNYILHLVSGEPEQVQAALIKVEQLLSRSNEQHKIRVEIVANGRGLNLLRSDVTPYADEIRALADRNVTFFACSNGIKRLESEGIKVQLVPEADPHFASSDRLVLRLQSDWNYIKI